VLFRFGHFCVALGELESDGLRQVGIEFNVHQVLLRILRLLPTNERDETDRLRKTGSIFSPTNTP
jgi:hypothetical protein